MKHDPLNDGISSVAVIEVMGSDLSVVNAARVSMAKSSEWEEAGEFQFLSVPDCKLLTYLAKHGHWTPFSHPQVSLRIKMPIFIARQWFKHMVGFTRNETSRRYVSDTPEVYVPKKGEWRLKADNVKQGSSDETFQDGVYIDPERRDHSLNSIINYSVSLYESMIAQGICPEQARLVLPQGMYTEFVETGSLAAYARLCSLRLDPHAQKEVRLYAEAVSKIMSDSFPASWFALNQSNGVTK